MKTKTKSSLDYPLMLRKLLEASPDIGTSKLPGGLYVVATPIGNLGDITLRAFATLAQADLVACEDSRVSGGLLNAYGLKQKLVPYHDHNAVAAGAALIAALQAGQSVALISDAGMPLISDPGYRLVQQCRELGIAVTVIPGASAVVTALAGCGLPSDRFHFSGFLPAKAAARQAAIADLKTIPGTHIIYEAPQRLAACLADLALVLGGGRSAVVARELTKLFEEWRRGSLSELADAYAEQDVKGEIVIIIGPADEADKPAHDIEALLRAALTKLSLRDAVAEVAEMTGVKKAEVYKRALGLAKSP